MIWNDLLGHQDLVEQFRRCAARGRLASTFLFVGPPGVGKRTFAMKLAQCLLCPRRPEEELDACGECSACQQVQALTHPDLEVVSKPADRSFIPVETFIGDREHRMRQGLCRNIALKPYQGGRRIAIIDDADALNQEGANCLLKTLEEPPPRSVIILIGTSVQRQLPTIRSRSQIIRFGPLSADDVAHLLTSTGVASADEAFDLAQLSDGSLTRAAELADEDLRSARGELLSALAQASPDTIALSKRLGQIVEQVGKEAPKRRVRLRQLLRFAADFYAAMARQFAGVPPHGDQVLEGAIKRAAGNRDPDPERAARCMQRSLEAIAHVDANANQQTLLDAWLDAVASPSSR